MEDTTEMAAARDANIPSYYNEEFFEEVLQGGLYDTHLKISDYQVRNMTIDGENYCSNIYQAKVRYQKEANEGVISLIIKSMPEEKQLPLQRLNIFSKETFFYLELKKKIEVLLMKLGEDFQFGAHYLFSCVSPENTIVFKDLTSFGFLLQKRQQGLDLEHSRLVLRKLAHYHASTMYLNEKEPYLLKRRYPFGLLNMETIKSEHFKSLFGAQLLKLISLLEDDPKDSHTFKDIISKMKIYQEQFLERILKAVYPLEGQWNVLNHGDLWTNNLFFKYENPESEKPKEVRFIDFQLCFFGSLGFDVNYFLTTSLQLEVLKNYRHHLIQLYCEELVHSMRKLDLKQTLPALNEIADEIHQKEPYGFFVSFAFFPLMSMGSQDSEHNSLQNLQQQEFAAKKIDLMFKGNPRTMDMLRYAVRRFNDLGIFD